MSAPIDHVRVLAGEIGPRGTGTAGEAAAARYAAGVLTSLGLPVERHTFRAAASQNAFPLLSDALALAGVALYLLGGAAPAVFGAVMRWAGAALALAAAPLLWQAIRTSTNPLGRLLATVSSQNVVARVLPQNGTDGHQGDARGSGAGAQVVVLAHLDTNRCRVAWQSGMVRWLEPLTWLTLAMLAGLGVLLGVGAALGGPRWAGLAALVPTAYVLGTVLTLIRDDQAPFSPGAHDNAASVAVALELAGRLAVHPPARLQVWLAFTGAEETDHAGLYALLHRHPELRRAAFIGLEGLGSGRLAYLTRQGLCAPYRPDPQLLAAARRVAVTCPALGAGPAQTMAEDEVGTLRRKGYRALCVAGLDPATGTLPHWHRAADTPATVSPEFMARAVDFVAALLHEMEGKV